MKRIIMILLIGMIWTTTFCQKFPQYIYPEGFELAITEGRVSGYSAISKFGVNLAITSATDPEDIWEYGGLYIYDPDSTAPIGYISSSSIEDTLINLVVQGLDYLGYEVLQTISLNGQNVVSLSTPLWRVYRMYNDDSISLTGTVYCGIDPTPTAGVPGTDSIRAIINDGHNQTLMALYTIPKGYVGFWYRGEIGVQYESATPAIADYLHAHLETRRYGKVFRVQKTLTISSLSGGYQDYRIFPDPVPSLTDIKTTVVEVSATMGVWATFDLLLVKETVFPTSYLKLIGQPGY